MYTRVYLKKSIFEELKQNGYQEGHQKGIEQGILEVYQQEKICCC